MTETREIVRNVHNEHLMLLSTDMFVFGYVDEAADSEVADFVPIRHELVQLVRYWGQTMLENDWCYFCACHDGCGDWTERKFAGLRLGRLAHVLGDPEVDRIVD